VELPGQPACYKPDADITSRQMHNLYRPAC
jgi:hypothetical protein